MLSNVTEFKTIGNNSEIVDGDNITLLCTTTMGQPSPRIEIRKPNGDLLINDTASSTGQTRTQYDFDQISKGERGTYSCQVTTEKFTSRKSLRLDIKCKLEFSVKLIFRTKQPFTLFYNPSALLVYSSYSQF